MKKNHAALFAAIEAATDGLTYVSETDAPVLTFAAGVAETPTREMILQHAGLECDTTGEEVSFDVFFARLTAIKDWFGESETTKAKKFLGLKTLLEENLRDLKVFRLGKIRVDIYVAGIDSDGSVLGVRTKAVET